MPEKTIDPSTMVKCGANEISLIFTPPNRGGMQVQQLELALSTQILTCMIPFPRI